MDLLSLAGDAAGIGVGVATGGLSTVLGGLIGAGARLIPEWLRTKQAKTDQEHEYRMAVLQGEQAKQNSEQRIREIEAQGAQVLDASGMDALIAAVKAQGQLTGDKWADRISATVRPFVTYWWMTLLTVYKLCVVAAGIIVASSESGSAVAFVNAVARVWTPDDYAILSGILNFWFLDRVIAKRGK